MAACADDPRAATLDYMERHQLTELLEGLLAELIFAKPRDPRAFIVAQLEKAKAAGTRPLLTRADLAAMHRMFDATQRGVVSEQQAATALRTVLGSRAPAAREGAAPLGPDEFVGFMASALEAATPLCRGSGGGGDG